MFGKFCFIVIFLLQYQCKYIQIRRTDTFRESEHFYQNNRLLQLLDSSVPHKYVISTWSVEIFYRIIVSTFERRKENVFTGHHKKINASKNVKYIWSSTVIRCHRVWKSAKLKSFSTLNIVKYICLKLWNLFFEKTSKIH